LSSNSKGHPDYDPEGKFVFDFWYSESHREEQRERCYVMMDGQYVRYTSICLTDSREPFPGALSKYPDYRKLISTSIYNVARS
jgi:hypothetical protein